MIGEEFAVEKNSTYMRFEFTMPKHKKREAIGST
jgi:hypothetical protein